MVLQAQTFPGGYRQSYSQDGYYSTGYGHGPNMHMGPTPHHGSSSMMHSSSYGRQHHQPGWNGTTAEYHSNGSNGNMSSAFSAATNFSHGLPHGAGHGLTHGASHSSSFHGGGSNVSHGSSFHGAGNNASHGMPAGSYGSSFHGATHSPMGSKVESMKHEYNNYDHGHSSMFHNPTHGGHQSNDWNLKSIEDDD